MRAIVLLVLSVACIDDYEEINRKRLAGVACEIRTVSLHGWRPTMCVVCAGGDYGDTPAVSCEWSAREASGEEPTP